MGRQADALQRFEVAEKLAPDDATLQYNMGLVLADLGTTRERGRMQKNYAAGIGPFPDCVKK